MKIIAVLAAFLGIVIRVAALMVACSILNGYVLSVLWGWFMVPVFHLPQLPVAPAIGLALIVSYLTYQPEPNYQEEEETAGQRFARSTSLVLGRPLLALLFGWIVHLFM